MQQKPAHLFRRRSTYTGAHRPLLASAPQGVAGQRAALAPPDSAPRPRPRRPAARTCGGGGGYPSFFHLVLAVPEAASSALEVVAASNATGRAAAASSAATLQSLQVRCKNQLQ